jgi:hypothetical protein
MNCEHIWIVTSWRLSDHSKTAQELMCQKCRCIDDSANVSKLRCKNVPRETVLDAGDLVSSDLV